MNIFKLVDEIIFGKPTPMRVNPTWNDDLHEASSTRGIFILGDPGTGKTIYATMQTVESWIRNPHPVFVWDWSGSITNCSLDFISRRKEYKYLLDKVRLVELGNDEYVVPTPEFHPAYGLTEEEQVARVVGNMEKLAEFLVGGAPFLAGVSIEEIGKHLFRLLTVIRNEQGENWQITEAADLLMDQAKLKRACMRFGAYAIPAKRYFEKQYLPKDAMPTAEKELTTRALRYILGKIDSSVARATLGYYEPRWTPKQAIENDYMVIIDAHKMINLPAVQHYLLMQSFSQVMAYINKREVDDPRNKVIKLVFDETYTILQIRGMAQWLGMVSPLYRSRKVSLMIIAQALWQFDETLAKQIWNLANVVCFTVSNADEAAIIAKQLFSYDPRFVKNPPKTEYQNPTTESVMGQDRIIADWLQNLKAREFIMRRYTTEQSREKGIQFVQKTDDYPSTPSHISLPEMKKYLIEKIGVKIRDSLEVIKEREKILDLDQSDPNF